MGKKAIVKLSVLFFYFLIVLLSVATAAGSFASHIDPNRFAAAGYAGPAIPFLIPVCLAAALWGGIRKKKWALLPLAAVLFNLNYLGAVVRYTGKKRDGGAAFKIATYNVHSFNGEKTGFSARQIARFLEEEAIDAVCFQEFNGNRFLPPDSLYRIFSRFPYRYVPLLPGNRTRLALFSRYPVTDSLFIPFPATDNCGLYADVSVHGKTVRIFNVHLQTTGLSQGQAHLAEEKVYYTDEEKIAAVGRIGASLLDNSKIRARQAGTIRAAVRRSPHPVVLCGDFNDTPASYTYRYLQNGLNDGFKTSGNGYQYTFNAFCRLLRLDYIFYSDGLKGRKYRSVHLPWSDHNPVVMQLVI